jgi:Lar family restriction alleviation protein
MDKLKPCPFCGSDNVQGMIGGDDSSTDAEFCVTCWDCHAFGPVSFVSLDEAVEKWNERADKSQEVLGRVLEYLSVEEIAVPAALLTEMLEVVWEVRPLDG